MASKISGWLRQRERASGMTWLWCFQINKNGRMVENSIPLGLVSAIGAKESHAWQIVGELKLVDKYINNPISNKPTFGELMAAYVKDGLPFRKKDGKRKCLGTIETYEYHIDSHILPRWRDVVVTEMKPLAILRWLYDLHDGEDYVWDTCSKIKGIVSLVFDFCDLHEIYTGRNPVDKVTIPASEDGNGEELALLKPEQVWALLERLPCPVRIAVLLVATTGLRVSEFLALRWFHVRWDKNQISIEQAFRRGEIQHRTKTRASNAPVPMCKALAEHLTDWRGQTAYGNDGDFIFASTKLEGRQPLWGQTLNSDFVKPAAVALGFVPENERFGWHRFRHSLSTWINEQTGDITVSQTLLRHAKPDTTAIYTHGNFGKALNAQEQYMEKLKATKPISEATQ
jgi:integrase